MLLIVCHGRRYHT